MRVITICMYWDLHDIGDLRGSEDNFVGLLLSFHIYVGSGGQTQVTRLAWQAPLPPKISCCALDDIVLLRLQ